MFFLINWYSLHSSSIRATINELDERRFCCWCCLVSTAILCYATVLGVEEALERVVLSRRKKRSKEKCNVEFAVQAKERALSAMRKSEEGCCASLLNCHIGRCRNINPIKLWLFPLPEWTLPLYMRPIGQRLFSSAATGWVIWLVAQMIFKARVCKIIHVISYGSDLFEMCDIIPKLRILIAKLNIN